MFRCFRREMSRNNCLRGYIVKRLFEIVKNKKGKLGLGWLALLMLPALLAVSVAGSRTAAKHGNYLKARRLAIILLENRIDERYIPYLDAGIALGLGKYREAYDSFLRLGDFRDAEELTDVAGCRLAEEMIGQRDFLSAATILNGSEQPEARFMMSKARFGALEEGAKLYREGKWRPALDWFEVAGPISDCDKYVKLCFVRGVEGEPDRHDYCVSVVDGLDRYETAFSLLGFEDAGKAILQERDMAEEFMTGLWKEETKYLLISKNGMLQIGVPWEEGGSYWLIENGELRVYSDEDRADIRSVLSFNVLSRDSVEVYDFMDGLTYTMERVL